MAATFPSSMRPVAYAQIDNLDTVKGLTVPGGAVYAVIVPEGAGVRWRDDGTAPTAVVGMPIADGDALFYAGRLSAVRFIQSAAGAKLNVAFYRP